MVTEASADDVLAQRIAALREIVDERDHRYEDRFRAMDEKTTLALSSSEKAVAKAEAAQEKRFDNTNEWRAAMQDRDRNQMPRVEIEQRFEAQKRLVQWMVGFILSLVIAVCTLVISILKH